MQRELKTEAEAICVALQGEADKMDALSNEFYNKGYRAAGAEAAERANFYTDAARVIDQLVTEAER